MERLQRRDGLVRSFHSRLQTVRTSSSPRPHTRLLQPSADSKSPAGLAGWLGSNEMYEARGSLAFPGSNLLSSGSNCLAADCFCVISTISSFQRKMGRTEGDCEEMAVCLRLRVGDTFCDCCIRCFRALSLRMLRYERTTNCPDYQPLTCALHFSPLSPLQSNRCSVLLQQSLFLLEDPRTIADLSMDQSSYGSGWVNRNDGLIE